VRSWEPIVSVSTRAFPTFELVEMHCPEVKPASVRDRSLHACVASPSIFNVFAPGGVSALPAPVSTSPGCADARAALLVVAALLAGVVAAAVGGVVGGVAGGVVDVTAADVAAGVGLLALPAGLAAGGGGSALPVLPPLPPQAVATPSDPRSLATLGR
jgi:hypothetical protein